MSPFALYACFSTNRMGSVAFPEGLRFASGLASASSYPTIISSIIRAVENPRQSDPRAAVAKRAGKSNQIMGWHCR